MKFREACVRCAIPRIDPGQQKRLIEITHSLTDRVNEAKLNGWLGEAEGVAGPLQDFGSASSALRDHLEPAVPGERSPLTPRR
ncbi:hypothetical protein [Streptomyces sp. NBC_01358]|uniref:hypothetical protein n=1 Tax=Streptomyces sp. NBC_01358 TaxID=2903837 RepID=UPI002E3192C9|nr:hypothetical protein [Streptomyces sp. NBC_01358]